MWQTVQKKGKNKSSQKKETPKQQAPVQNAGAAPSQKAAAPPVPQSQPTKGNNKSNRVREINNKGATKEGTDMDAFNDKQPQSTPVNNVANVVASDIFNANSVPITNINNNNNINEFGRTESIRTEPALPEVQPTKTEAPVEVSNEPRNDNANAEAQRAAPKPEIKSFTRRCVTDIVKEVPRPIKISVPAQLENSDETDCTAVTNDRIVQVKNDVNKTFDGEGNVESKAMPQYKEGQWSPANPSGKKVYDKDFLMFLKDDPKSKKKPNCNIIDVVAVDDKRGGDNKYPMGGRSDFAGNFNASKSSSQRGGNGKGGRRSIQGQPGVNNNKNSNKKVMSFSLREDVKLHETEHAWKPARFVPSEVMSDEDKKTEILYKKMRGILNKLTPQKFDVLVGQIRQLNIDTTERLQGIMDLVFEKALDEPNFSEAYAKLCKELRRTSVNNEKDSNSFIKLLVMRCQMEFEKYLAEDTETATRRAQIEAMDDPEKKKELMVVLEEDERRLRIRSVGNVRFIGELFKFNMLTIRIMESCLKNLVSKRDDEEKLECLCKLLTTIGHDLEYTHKMELKPYIDIMQDIVKNTKTYKISSRVRFMLKDTIDLRDRKWVPRRANLAPKTMDQIQKEAENEQLNIQVMNSMPSSHRKDDRGSMGGGNSDRKGNNRRNANVTNEEGWTTAAASRSNRSGVLHVQVDKLKTKAPEIDDPLGSNKKYSIWAQGSTIKPQNSPNNIFTCLDNNLETEKRAMGPRGSTSRDFAYISKSSSMERHGKYDGRGSRSGSQHRSNDSRDMRQQPQQPAIVKMPPPAPKAVAPSPPPVDDNKEPMQLSDTQLSYVTNTLDEYTTGCSSQDEAIEEIFNKIPEKAYRTAIVDAIVMHTLESQRLFRVNTGTLLATMLSRRLITVDDVSNVCVFEAISDFIIDLPKLFNYLVELTFQPISENALLLSKLAKALAPVKPNGYGRKFLEALSQMFIEDKGPAKLQQVMQASGCSLKDFVHEGEIEEFIAKNKLDFLTGATVQPVGHSNNSPEQLHAKLIQFLKDKESFDTIVSWINANIGHQIKEDKYIYSLAMAIYENSIQESQFESDVLKTHYKLLLKFTDHNTDLEVQCLVALQRLLYRLEYPRGILVNMFNQLYVDGIFTQESFIQWKKSAVDIEGKGIAMKQLTNFFNNIYQTMCEDDGSDEDSLINPPTNL